MTSTKLKKGDNVKIITGKDKGKEGKILLVDRKKGKIIVEGINMIHRHTKPNQQNQQGGIINKEAPIDASNAMYLHKGKPTRLGAKVVKEMKDGKEKTVKYRVAKSTGEVIE